MPRRGAWHWVRQAADARPGHHHAAGDRTGSLPEEEVEIPAAPPPSDEEGEAATGHVGQRPVEELACIHLHD